MATLTVLLAAAFVAAEGGEELRLFQTTETKDFREIATPGFTIHPYPAVKALDVDAAPACREVQGQVQDASAPGRNLVCLDAGVQVSRTLSILEGIRQ